MSDDVVDHHPFPQLVEARQPLLVIEDELLLHPRHWHRRALGGGDFARPPAGRHHDRVRRQRQHRLDRALGPQSDVDAAPFALRRAPVGEVGHLRTARQALREPDLAPQTLAALEQRHPMAARRRHPGGFQPRRPAADDHDPPRRAAGSNVP